MAAPSYPYASCGRITPTHAPAHRCRDCRADLDIGAGTLGPAERPRRLAAKRQLHAGRHARPPAGTVTATGLLTWRNISSRAATALQFHLYWNAWRDPSSSWLREQSLGRNWTLARRPASDSRQHRSDDAGVDHAGAEAGSPGPRDVHRARRRQRRRQDGARSAARSRLSPPATRLSSISAGPRSVPRTYARTGRIGNYFFIAQWFPKIGVFEDGGWNCHQFHAATEFFADFGVYDVSLTVPTGWMVGATGREQCEDRQRRRHDHASLPAGRRPRLRLDDEPGLRRATRAVRGTGSAPVDMRLLLQPEHLEQADRHFSATRTALKYYGTWFGAVSVQPHHDRRSGHDLQPGVRRARAPAAWSIRRCSPPARGGSRRGREHNRRASRSTRPVISSGTASSPPTSSSTRGWTRASTRIRRRASIADGVSRPQFVTVERYFGGLGFWAYTDVPWSRDIDGNRLNAFRPVASFDDAVHADLAVLARQRQRDHLQQDRAVAGDARAAARLADDAEDSATHFARGTFRHPTPDEFFAIANEVSGRDLTWFFDAVHRSSATFDYAVAQVTSSREDADSTRRRPPTRRRHLSGPRCASRFDDGSDSDRGAGTAASGGTRSRYREERARRDGRGRSGARAAARPELHEQLVDRATARRRGREQVGVRWLTWAQDLLLTYAFFA